MSSSQFFFMVSKNCFDSHAKNSADPDQLAADPDPDQPAERNLYLYLECILGSGRQELKGCTIIFLFNPFLCEYSC